MEKIVFVIEQLKGGGAERVTAALMNQMCAQTEIHLISTYDHDLSKDYPVDSRVIKHTFRAACRNHAELILKRIMFLRRTIKELDPMCVVSLGACGSDTVLTASMLGLRIPLVLSERNDPARSPESKLLRLLRPINYMLCDGLVFQTNGAREYFPDFIAKKSAVIPNPITGSLPPRHEGARVRRRINCCRLMPQKNLGLLIDAFSDISAEFADVTLEIWGEGPERAKLEARIREMKLEDRVRLPGYTDDAYALLSPSLMFVSSSDYEGISNSMLEAMALGVPTVCTDCPAGGARESIRDGESGLLVPVGDRKALAAAMKRLLTDPALAEKLSRNGYGIREEISAAAISRKWLEYIHKIAYKK